MLTALGVISMLIVGTVLWFRKLTKVSGMLERMIDEEDALNQRSA